MRSIRTFLLIAISSITILVFLLAAFISFKKASYEVDELFDAELAQTARILRSTLWVEKHRAAANPVPEPREISTHDWARDSEADGNEERERTKLGHSYERKIMFQVRRGEHVILRSDNSPLKANLSLQEGYEQLTADGFRWHLFTLLDGDMRYTVGERGDIRDEVARKIALSNLAPSLLALPVLLLLLVVTLRKGLRPLNDLDQRIQERGKDNLDPIDLPSTPDEILPIVESLNALLVRLRRSLDSERRFSAMASHEMRTPLAVLKVNVQNALKTQSKEDRVAILQDIDASVDRASRLINQLLTLSRLEQDSTGFQTQPLDVLPVLREEIAALYPIVLQRNQTIELLETGNTIVINTVPQMFPLIVRNLVDNAIKYSPEGGSIRVSIAQTSRYVELQVEDSGPGVPEAEREKIFERFYRIPTATATGSGLGLAIVKRITELLQVPIQLGESAELGGLSVSIRFQA